MILIIENDYMLVNFWFLHRFGHILFILFHILFHI